MLSLGMDDGTRDGTTLSLGTDVGRELGAFELGLLEGESLGSNGG